MRLAILQEHTDPLSLYNKDEPVLSGQHLPTNQLTEEKSLVASFQSKGTTVPRPR